MKPGPTPKTPLVWLWLAGFAWLALVPLARPAEAVILLTVDLQSYTLTALDAAEDVEALPLVLAVSVGSPAHPTPTGRYRPGRVILNPAWTPSEVARRFGAEPEPPSEAGPMGIAKIPFAQKGEVALHGGAVPIVLGKPISMGCVRLADAGMRALLDWLEERGALAAPRSEPSGEIVRAFRRTVQLEVR